MSHVSYPVNTTYNIRNFSALATSCQSKNLPWQLDFSSGNHIFPCSHMFISIFPMFISSLQSTKSTLETGLQGTFCALETTFFFFANLISSLQSPKSTLETGLEDEILPGPPTTPSKAVFKHLIISPYSRITVDFNLVLEAAESHEDGEIHQDVRTDRDQGAKAVHSEQRYRTAVRGAAAPHTAGQAEGQLLSAGL